MGELAGGRQKERKRNKKNKKKPLHNQFLQGRSEPTNLKFSSLSFSSEKEREKEKKSNSAGFNPPTKNRVSAEGQAVAAKSTDAPDSFAVAAAAREHCLSKSRRGMTSRRQLPLSTAELLFFLREEERAAQSNSDHCDIIR